MPRSVFPTVAAAAAAATALAQPVSVTPVTRAPQGRRVRYPAGPALSR